MMRLLKQKNTKLITGEEIHLNLYLQQEKNLDPQKMTDANQSFDEGLN